jgi:hypothetical protein
LLVIQHGLMFKYPPSCTGGNLLISRNLLISQST